MGWIWERSTIADPRYVSHTKVDWHKILTAVGHLAEGREEKLRIGLLNFNATEVHYWKVLMPTMESVLVHLDNANPSITWETLFPEWIDEEEESEVPSCPSLPNPLVTTISQVDAIAVKLPCHRRESGNWSRDIARLHLQLAAAKIAASAKYSHPMQVLFVTDCFPIPNLFTCKELTFHEGNVWMYKPNLRTIREKLQLPIGSCELSVPLEVKGELSISTARVIPNCTAQCMPLCGLFFYAFLF